MAMLRWIASYPKSGNTWFKLVLASLNREDGALDINAVDPLSFHAASRALIDEYAGLETVGLPHHTVERLRPQIYETIATEHGRDVFLKCHEPFRRLDNGAWLLPPQASGPSVYLIRDPRDVAVSLAHHSCQTFEWAITVLETRSHALSTSDEDHRLQVRQTLGTWSSNVESWAGAPIDVLILRYEDMVTDPIDSFRTAAIHLGLKTDDTRLRRAVDACRFDTLRHQEQVHGFNEAPRPFPKRTKERIGIQPQAPVPFFRRGIAGSWRDTLSPDQTRRIEESHGPVMHRFGYL